MFPGTPDTDSPTPSPDPTAEPTARRRTGVLAGALLGALALTASVVGVSAIAGAQDDPEVDEPDTVEATELGDEDLDDFDGDLDHELWAPFEQCLTDALGPLDDDAEEPNLSDAEWEALEAQLEAAEAACEDLLPEEAKAEIAAWQPYDDCIDAQLGETDVDDEGELSDDEWEALEEQWKAADDACFDLLPEDAKAEAQAFEAYDQCLTDAGLGEDMGAMVYVEDGETGQSIRFGEAVGTVTITGDGSGVTVATDGDVTIVDDEAVEAAFDACDELLPEDLFEWDEDGEFDEFDGDLDEGDDDELEGDDEGDEDDDA